MSRWSFVPGRVAAFSRLQPNQQKSLQERALACESSFKIRNSVKSLSVLNRKCLCAIFMDSHFFHYFEVVFQLLSAFFMQNFSFAVVISVKWICVYCFPRKRISLWICDLCVIHSVFFVPTITFVCKTTNNIIRPLLELDAANSMFVTVAVAAL